MQLWQFVSHLVGGEQHCLALPTQPLYALLKQVAANVHINRRQRVVQQVHVSILRLGTESARAQNPSCIRHLFSPSFHVLGYATMRSWEEHELTYFRGHYRAEPSETASP